jgi:hypothetical protein
LAGFKGRVNVQTSPAAAVFAPGREKRADIPVPLNTEFDQRSTFLL